MESKVWNSCKSCSRTSLSRFTIMTTTSSNRRWTTSSGRCTRRGSKLAYAILHTAKVTVFPSRRSRSRWERRADVFCSGVQSLEFQAGPVRDGAKQAPAKFGDGENRRAQYRSAHRQAPARRPEAKPPGTCRRSSYPVHGQHAVRLHPSGHFWPVDIRKSRMDAATGIYEYPQAKNDQMD